MSEERFWAVDVEGNGARPPEVVELAMQEVVGLRLTGRRLHWLVRPSTPVTPFASGIHGLTDADLADAPSMEDIADDVVTWLQDARIVGHNVKVELDVLGRQLEGWRPSQAIDTLRMARALRPGLPSYGLDRLGGSLGVRETAASLTGRGHHSALFDATLAALVFVELLSALPTELRPAVVRDADLLNPGQGRLI